MSTREEKRFIDRNPANKCQADGCGNTRRLDERFCGLHMPNGLDEIEQRIADREQRLDALEARIGGLPDTGDMLELRQILEEIVRNLR